MRRSQRQTPSPQRPGLPLRAGLLFAVLAAIACWGERAAAQPVPAPHKLLVYATSDTDGELASPRCRARPILNNRRLEYAHQVGYYRQLVEETAENDSAFEPIAVHLGDAVFPGPVGRYLLQQGSEGGRDLAEILAQLPFETMTLGNREIGLGQDELTALVEGALAEGIDLRAANVVCTPEGGAEALCEALGTAGDRRPYDVIERGDLDIMLVSVLDPAIRSSIAISRLVGVDILDPTAVLRRKLDAYRREADPDLVFLQYHTTSATELEAVVRLARRVRGIDVVTTNKQLDPGEPRRASSRNGFVLAPKTGTYIVPAGRSPTHASLSELWLRRDPADGSWSIERVDSRQVDTMSGPVEPATAQLLWDASAKLCRRWGAPISAEAPLDERFYRSDFTTFAMNVMRFTANAEVALLNDGAVLRSDNFPLSNHLTFADIYTILPFDNPLVVLRIKGEELEKLAAKLDGPALAEGLSVSGSQVLVNGRPIQPGRTYDVATNRFVADGGDEIVPAEAIASRRVYEPGWTAETPSISDLLIHFVTSGNYARRGAVDRRLSPEGNFPDLHEQFLWQLVGSLNASYNSVTVRNPTVGGSPAYEQSQLSVKPTNQINLEGSFNANADSRRHGWDNALLLQYAAARVNGGNQAFNETKDLIRLKSRYKYAGFRSEMGGNWWVPMPTVEVQAESEFDRPDDRGWHKVEVTGIVGSSFRLFEPFELKLGVDVRRDVNDPGAETEFGITAAYTLSRFDLAEILESPVQFESEFEYFHNNILEENIQEIRATSRLFYSLYDRLHLTATFSAFLFRTTPVGSFGRNAEFTVGLNYLWDKSIQTF